MKKLAKSSQDRRISGVCSGIAEYFGIDPAIVRIIFGIAFFVFGSGLVPYIILSFVLPYDYEVDGNVTSKRNDQWQSVSRHWTRDTTSNATRKDVTPQNDDEWSDF